MSSTLKHVVEEIFQEDYNNHTLHIKVYYICQMFIHFTHPTLPANFSLPLYSVCQFKIRKNTQKSNKYDYHNYTLGSRQNIEMCF